MFETFRTRKEELPRLTMCVRNFADNAGLKSDIALGLELAADEAASNIIDHAYNEGGNGEINMVCSVQNGEIQLEMYDSGKPFNPTTAIKSAMIKSINDKDKGGFGLLLMRHFTDNIRYRYTPDGKNHLTLAVRLDNVA